MNEGQRIAIAMAQRAILQDRRLSNAAFIMALNSPEN
jgi:hypothetical protein